MRTNWLVTGLFALLSHLAYAQKTPVSIFLEVSGKEPVANATLQIYSSPGQTLLQTKIGRPDSTVFLLVPFSQYLVQVSAIGFETKRIMVFVGAKPLSLLVALTPRKNMLDTAVIVAKRPLMRQEDDKTVIDAENLSNSSTSAYEVLEKTPGATMDQDGNVYISGSTPAAIYINGREMKMSRDDIASFLRSLPAGSVSKIEITRTPSSKYAASGSGGIVNVVLKKGVKTGTTGSFNIRYDQGVYGTLSAGASIGKSGDRINSYFSYQHTRRNYFETIESHRITGVDTLLSQTSFTKSTTVTDYAGAGADYALGKKLTIAYDLRLTFNKNKSDAISTNELTQGKDQSEFFESRTPVGNNGRALLAANSLSLKYKIDSVGSEWVNEIDYSYSRNKNLQQYTDNYLLPVAPDLSGSGNTHTTNGITDIRSDLSLKLPHQFKLESGVMVSLSRNGNNALYYKQTGNSAPRPDTFQTNEFSYREHIYSAYSQLTRTFRSFIFKAGLRFERYDSRGRQAVPQDTSFYIARGDWFPYFYIRRPLFKVLGYPLTGNVVYRKSITRPGYDALNPSPKFIDPFTYTTGNPKLRPQFTANYEVNATYNDFPVFSVGVNDTKDFFSQVTYADDTTKIVYRTYDNLGKNRELYARLFGGLPAGGPYFMYVGVQFNHIAYDGAYGGLPLHYRRGSWTLFTGHEWKATPALRFNAYAWMYINGFRSFNELNTLGQLNLSVVRSLLDKKISIILSATDVFRTNKSVFHLQQGGLAVYGSRIQDSRRVGLTFRYNFGIVPKEEKKPSFSPPAINTDPNNN